MEMLREKHKISNGSKAIKTKPSMKWIVETETENK